jgi:hypothetical protein
MATAEALMDTPREAGRVRTAGQLALCKTAAARASEQPRHAPLNSIVATAMPEISSALVMSRLAREPVMSVSRKL